MAKKRKKTCPLPEIQNSLPEENRREIASLISYINNVLLIRVQELTEEVSRLRQSSVSNVKFDLTLSDDEDVQMTPKK